VEIEFYPKSWNTSKEVFMADIKTAGSIGLLIQVCLPCLVFSPQSHLPKLILKGGTNAENAPQIDYTTSVFQPIAEKFGINFDLNLIRRGYYPQGGGEVEIKCRNSVEYLNPITILERGEISSVLVRSFVSGKQTIKVAETMSDKAIKLIQEYFSLAGKKDVKIELQNLLETPAKAFGSGLGIVIVAESDTGCKFAGTALGEYGKTADEIGSIAAKSLITSLEHGGCMDEYLQDQLILFMGLANGTSRIKTGPLSLHTRTSIHFTECMTGCKFTVEPQPIFNNNTVIIECKGIGYRNSHVSPSNNNNKSDQ